MKGHAGKDFWNSAVVLVSKDEKLTKSHIRYLEGKLIEIATKNGTSLIINAAASGAKLPWTNKSSIGARCLLILLIFPLAGFADITGRVVSVTDGDTIKVLDSSNTQYKVRLTGIDAPERGQPFGGSLPRPKRWQLDKHSPTLSASG